MSEAEVAVAPARKPRKKAEGPRNVKPIYLVVRYRDEEGNQVKLDKARLSVETTKDPGKVIDLIESGDLATVVSVKVEPEARANPAA